jgi:protein phosphatase
VVLDLGCGEGRLRRRLLAERQFTEIVGLDVSSRTLDLAESRLKLDRLSEKQRERIRLLHGSLMYRDARLHGFDAAAVVEHERGPFDIIGDVHGCCDELEELLAALGYVKGDGGGDGAGSAWAHPEGRKAIFVGDLVDRGPRIVDTLKTVMSMVRAGTAMCVPGNHDTKLKRKLEGHDVKISHGLDLSLAELDRETPEFQADVQRFLHKLISHFVLDDGALVVAHAGLKEEMQGRASAKVWDFALFGDVTGEIDEYGLPVRNNWAADYRGRASVVYGHTPAPKPEWLNRTINIDTGCVFGGSLTALRWPEKTLMSVPARAVYAESKRPFLKAAAEARALSVQQSNDDLLDIDHVRGKRLVETRLLGTVTVREENTQVADLSAADDVAERDEQG